MHDIARCVQIFSKIIKYVQQVKIIKMYVLISMQEYKINIGNLLLDVLLL